MEKAGKAGGELELIKMIRRGSVPAHIGLERAGGRNGKASGVVLGIGDDCAILQPGKANEVLVTTDFSLEGRHFRRDLHTPESVGHRCLARGLSDIAAMGGRPVAAFLSLALPAGMPGTKEGKAWMAGFLRGMRALAERYEVPLAGGDTAESPADAILADITLVGSAEAGTALRRSSGKAGDSLYCTGRLGGAAAELEAMMAGNRLAKTSRAKPRWTGDHPQMFPEPRLQTGAMLRQRGLARACIDLSDGLSTDLSHLCAESGVGADVEEALLPVHRLAILRGEDKALELALNGGEDYELLFSAPARMRVPPMLGDVEITRIGRLVGAPQGERKMVLVRKDGSRKQFIAGGWEHFATKST